MPNSIDNKIDVNRYIENSETMAYSWYHRKDFVRHTGFVISFDGAQTFSLDFGPDSSEVKNKIKIAVAHIAIATSSSPSKKETAKKIAASMKLNGLVDLNFFCGTDVKMKSVLIELPTKSKEDKENAMNTFKCITKIDIGTWQLLENNCRDYVIAVATYLREYPEMKEENWKQFKQEMEKLKEEDKQKFDSVKKFAMNKFANQAADEAVASGSNEAQNIQRMENTM